VSSERKAASEERGVRQVNYLVERLASESELLINKAPSLTGPLPFRQQSLVVTAHQSSSCSHPWFSLHTPQHLDRQNKIDYPNSHNMPRETKEVSSHVDMSDRD
jgi:hypothetical protein